MSLIQNDIVREMRIEKNQGAFEREIPEKYLLDGEPIYSEAYLKELMNADEKEKMRNWDETAGDNNII